MLRISTYLRAIAGHSPAPRAAKPGSTRAPVVIWNVLRRCNLTCKHCYSTSADIDFKGELDTAEALGTGVIAFTPLAQGLLTDKYLNGIPADARINRPGGGSLQSSHLSQANIAHVRALNEIAKRRGQSLAQMALAWTLRDPRVTSALIGASRPEQIIENVAALQNLNFSHEELAEIDRFAQEGGINLWQKPSTAE